MGRSFWVRCNSLELFSNVGNNMNCHTAIKYRKMQQTGEIFSLVLIMYINILLLLSNWMQPFRFCLSGCLSNKTAQDSQTWASLGSELQLEQTCYDDLSLLLFVTESRRNFKWQKCVCAVPSCQILMASTPL